MPADDTYENLKTLAVATFKCTMARHQDMPSHVKSLREVTRLDGLKLMSVRTPAQVERDFMRFCKSLEKKSPS